MKIFLISVLSLIACEKSNLDNIENEKNKVLKFQDKKAYVVLQSHFLNKKNYYDLLPFSVMMTKGKETSGCYDFYKIYLQLQNNHIFDENSIEKLDQPEKDFLIYLLKKGAQNNNKICQKQLDSYYEKGIK